MPSDGGRSRIDGSDRGAVLVLTLILTVVLAAVVVALASYVTVGLRTSDTATERSNTNFDAANVMSWAIEQFSSKHLRPSDCGEAPNYLPVSGVPSALWANGAATTLECAQTLPGADPVVHLIATSVGDQRRVVEATISVPRYVHGARISDWRVDIPIDVVPYSTTTTVATTSTTTTSTTIANAPPTASPSTLTINPNTISAQSVVASDSDGFVASVSFSSVPSNLVITPTTGPSFTIDADGTPGTFVVPFEVTDDDGATSPTANLTIEVNSTATTTTVAPTTTTTTTLAPNPTCSFTVTSADGDHKAGIANLAVSNSGGAFNGWQVQIGWPNSWSASWEPAVTASLPAPNVVVSGTQSVPQSATLNFTATLAWNSGNPKIFVNETRPCTVLSP